MTKILATMAYKTTVSSKSPGAWKIDFVPVADDHEFTHGPTYNNIAMRGGTFDTFEAAAEWVLNQFDREASIIWKGLALERGSFHLSGPHDKDHWNYANASGSLVVSRFHHGRFWHEWAPEQMRQAA